MIISPSVVLSTTVIAFGVVAVRLSIVLMIATSSLKLKLSSSHREI